MIPFFQKIDVGGYIGVPYGGQVVEVGVFLMVGWGSIPLLGIHMPRHTYPVLHDFSRGPRENQSKPVFSVVPLSDSHSIVCFLKREYPFVIMWDACVL